MGSWPTKRLDELCEVTSSKRIYATELVSDGVPFLKSKEIIEKVNGQPHTNLLYISEHRFREIAQQTGSIEEGDVLLTSRGTLGVPYVVNATDRFHFADGNLTWFRRLSGLDSNYLRYFLLSPNGKAELSKCVIGSSQQAYTIAALKKAEIPLPPLPIQRRIAGILSAYDELIENSQRRIKILESMARTIYREWFVHFRFPGHESVPRVPSPLGEIPQGWQVRRIGDVFQTVLGGTPSRARPDFWKDGTVPWINSGKVNDLRITEASELITELALQKSAAKLMPKGTTVLAITGATLGQVSYLEIEAAANQSVVGIVDTSEIRSEWLYLTVCERIEGIIKHASGGAQQHINKEIVNDVQVAIPPDSLAKDFRQLVAPMFREIATLLFQVQNLRRTRDLLLPRLLSGQIDVDAMPS